MNTYTNGVEIIAPGRIHFGLLQMSERYSVMNMGFGLALEEPCWRLKAQLAHENSVNTTQVDGNIYVELIESAKRLLDSLQSRFNGPTIEINIHEGISPHVGLGSKTSFLCAILAGYCAFIESESWYELRYLTGRGGTSGIGINLAAHGGLILDAGHREDPRERIFAPSTIRIKAEVPPVICRWEIPEWPILIVTLKDAIRIYGESEKKAFKKGLPISTTEAEHLAAISMFELMPAIASHDYLWFSSAMAAMQSLGFKRYEWSLQAASVHRLRDLALLNGANCVALTSMGPTLIILGGDLDNVESAIRSSMSREVKIYRTMPRNKGIEVQYES